MKESGEQRESTFTNSATIFKVFYLTQGTVRTVKDFCGYCHKCISLVKSMRFVFFNKIYYLNWIPMGHITSYAQPVVTIVFLI